MDGASPPKLSDEWRQVYLDTVQTVCNEMAFRDEEDHDFEVPPCYDLGLFLKYASSVRDLDFHYAGMAPFEPPGMYSPASDISQGRENLIESLHNYHLCEVSFLCANMHNDLGVRVGLQTGIGIKYKLGGHDTWYSMYLYCRRYVEDSDHSHKDWAWRVVISDAEGVGNPATVYGQKPRFDSIVEFLDWYSSWLEYLDMGQVREDVVVRKYDRFVLHGWRQSGSILLVSMEKWRISCIGGNSL